MTLEERISLLEKSNRWLRVAVTVFVAGFVLLVGVGANNMAQPVSTEELVITDAAGNGRMILRAGPSGPQIWLRDSKGKTLIDIGIEKGANGAEAPRIRLNDSNEKISVVIDREEPPLRRK